MTGRERFALSTMWAQRQGHTIDLARFAHDAAFMGFGSLELSHILSAGELSTLPADARVTAVHHPCPRDGVEPGAHLTSADPALRVGAARGLRATLETAGRVGASVVVVHLGAAGDDETTAEELRRGAFEVVSRYRAGQSPTERYRSARDALVARVRAAEETALARAADALVELLPEARGRGLTVAFETGYDPRELPTPAGAERLLASLGDHGLAAWLDTGHVGAQAALGTASFAVWRAAVGESWAGAHLHDIVGLRDHLAPGAGGLDFPRILAGIPADAPLTLEVDWYLAPEEVMSGADHAARAFDEAVLERAR